VKQVFASASCWFAPKAQSSDAAGSGGLVKQAFASASCWFAPKAQTATLRAAAGL